MPSTRRSRVEQIHENLREPFGDTTAVNNRFRYDRTFVRIQDAFNENQSMVSLYLFYRLIRALERLERHIHEYV